MTEVLEPTVTADMTATATAVSGEISPDERMPTADLADYMEVGRSALRAIRLAKTLAKGSDFTSILDMPCGHGRVLRWLRAAYPSARITACDLLTDGVDFCARTFAATPVYSRPTPTVDMFSQRYDLIFVGSLLTHVDADRWDALIALWDELLLPGGLLMITTHGDLVAERMRGGDLYGYPAKSISRLLRTYENMGFGFLEEAPTSIEYGITLARPDWTLARLQAPRDLRVVLYSGALWHDHQDVAAAIKRGGAGARPASTTSTRWLHKLRARTT
jgi:SAM-dependent methyltransferase